MGIWDSLTGQTASDASNAAAADTYAKQKKATKALNQAGDQYATGLSELSTKYQPYVDAGTGALKMSIAGLGLDGGAGSQAFTDAYRATPGYGAALETGQNALLQQLSASGRLNTGAAQKAALQYGQNFEDQKSGDYLTRLLDLSKLGKEATGQQVATAGQGLQGQLGARTTAYQGDMTAAGTIGQGMVAGANAEQGAVGNLLGTAAYLGGAAFGGPVGTSLAAALKPAAPRTSSYASPWTSGVPQLANLGGYAGAA